MAITNTSTITEITLAEDALTANSDVLSFTTRDTTFANGHGVNLFYSSTSTTQTYRAQIIDENNLPVGDMVAFAYGARIQSLQIFDLGNDLFAVASSSTSNFSGYIDLVVRVFDSTTAAYVSEFGAARSAGHSEPVSFFSLASGGYAFSYRASVDMGQTGTAPQLDYWGFIGIDGNLVTKDFPASLITNLGDQVSINGDYVAIYDTVTDVATGAAAIELTVYENDGARFSSKNIVVFERTISDVSGADILTPDFTFLGDNHIVVTYELAGQSGSFARIYDLIENGYSSHTFDAAFGTIENVGLAEFVNGLPSFVALFSDGITRQFSFENSNELIGDGADDIFLGTSGDDVMQGNGGNDTFMFSGGDDVFDGGAGFDTIDFSNATSGQIVSLRDTRAEGGNEAAISIEVGIGSDFADVMVGSANADTLLGGDGEDYIYWSTGADVIDGGDGIDTYVFFSRPINGGPISQASTGAFETRVDLAAERLSFTHYNDPSLNPSTIVIQNIENFTGSDSWDTIIGTAASNMLNGGGGKDTIYGGTFGFDILTGGTGEDIFVVAPRTHVSTPNGEDVHNNTTRITDFEIGVDKIDLGGLGRTYSTFARGVAEAGIAGITDDGDGNAVLDMNMGSDGQTVTDRVVIIGVSAADLSASDFILPTLLPNSTYDVIDSVVYGTFGNDVIDLSAGPDTYVRVLGGGGDDTITGTQFGDDIYGGDGADSLYGGDGDDVLNFDLADIQGGATISGGAGIDTAYNRQTFEEGSSSAAHLTFNMTAGTIERYIGSTAAETIDGRGSVVDLYIDAGGAISARDFGPETASNPYFDTVYGGDGNDDIRNAEVVDAGAGDDIVYMTNGAGAQGGLGNDTLYVAGSFGLNLSQQGFETVFMSTSGYNIDADLDATGVSHSIRLVGGRFRDTLTGGDFADTLEGGAENDMLYGMGGDDILIGGFGLDTLYGGDGTDIAVFTGNAADYDITESNGKIDVVHRVYASSALNEGSSTLRDIETLRFADGDINIDTASLIFTEDADVISATFRSETLNGLGGNDVIRGQGGDDVISGQAGNDTLYGGDGADTLSGGEGDDYLYFDADDVTSGGLSGGMGYDTAIAEDLYTSSIILLNFDSMGIERIFATHLDDRIDGSASTENLTVYGFGGSDIILTGSGDDYIFFDHDDLSGPGGIRANGGYDWLINNSSSADSGSVLIDMATLQAEGYYGTSDADLTEVITASGISTSVTIYGNGGADQITGGSGDDYIYVNSDTAFFNGGNGYDYLIFNTFDGTGLSVNLTSTGFEGAVGRGGNDTFNASGNTVSASLYGAGGNDILIGGSATDYLYGDQGDDTYTGNGNTDYFLHDNTFGRDTITDFAIGTDVMIIRTAGVASMADILFTQDGADAILTMGANSIRLTGVTAASLSAGDFIFAPTSAEPIDVGPEADAQESKADISDPVMGDFANVDDANSDAAIIVTDEMTADLYEDYVLGHEAEAWVVDVYGMTLL